MFSRDVFAVMSASGENVAVDHEMRTYVKNKRKKQQQHQCDNTHYADPAPNSPKADKSGQE